MQYLLPVFIFSLTLLATEYTNTIRFAPLPMQKAETVIKQFEPFTQYLQKQTRIQFETIYAPNYDNLISRFIKGDIDIAYLGPLPYVKLHNKYPDAIPLIRFLGSNGEASYTCSLIRRSGVGAVPFEKIGSVALTQPTSTCGYLMTEKILKKHGLSLSNHIQYTYTGSHTNSILSVILGESDAGGVKTSISKRYMFHQLEIIDESDPIPGFALVYNAKTVDKSLIDTLYPVLQSLNPKQLSEMSRWGTQLRYGTTSVTHADYQSIIDAYNMISIPEH